MVRLPTAHSCVISMLIVVTRVLGCGVMPPGQASTRSFTVTGFTLPVSMAYSGDANVRARVSGIATSKEAATGFVSRLVLDVLEQRGRSALLSDAIISNILGQLNVRINYEPLECKAVALDTEVTMEIMPMDGKLPHCTIVSSTVTGTCPKRNQMPCKLDMVGQEIVPVSTNHTTISGTLMTTNIIMANWSRQMWQSVINRAFRILATRPFGSHFFSAVVTVT
ncbi:hypothetical protein KIN20_016646 [Parelaphostrongylus tenuis]|uniref:Secreted protein n=1 Tax=Parelaphostrongylus tenuis TaxID=148309 RepID=A0AAD5QN26_PARTN|nr:hypothetical protein KIN20_016646 [Parelaphostrongylus tenuis]